MRDFIFVLTGSLLINCDRPSSRLLTTVAVAAMEQLVARPPNPLMKVVALLVVHTDLFQAFQAKTIEIAATAFDGEVGVDICSLYIISIHYVYVYYI